MKLLFLIKEYILCWLLVNPWSNPENKFHPSICLLRHVLFQPNRITMLFPLTNTKRILCVRGCAPSQH